MRTLKLISLLGVSLAVTASANAQFSVAGGGAVIGDNNSTGTFPTTLPAAPGESCATVPGNVTSITSIEVSGLNHTWAGDLQMTLCDPNGTEHNIFVRPGFGNTSNFGASGDFVGDYTFVESGGSSLPTSSGFTADVTPGTYNQSFDTGGVVWNSGDAGILNTPMSSITGPQGDWCVKIYDWGNGDTGAYGGIVINGTSGNNECFQVIGGGPGGTSFTPQATTLPTQLNSIDLVYPVLQDSLPTFMIGQSENATWGANGSIMPGLTVSRRFAVQTIMNAPDVFVNDPIQWTNGLQVYINGRGNVRTATFGDGTMNLWAQTGVNAAGEKTLQFPFTMPQ